MLDSQIQQERQWFALLPHLSARLERLLERFGRRAHVLLFGLGATVAAQCGTRAAHAAQLHAHQVEQRELVARRVVREASNTPARSVREENALL